MLIGYARVSTGDQNLDLQKNALVRAECEQIFEDTASGKNSRRPGLRRAIRRLKPGDSLVVWKLDALGVVFVTSLLWSQSCRIKVFTFVA